MAKSSPHHEAFAQRLNEALNDFKLKNKSEVKRSAILVNCLGCSPQMCQRYLTGNAIPSIPRITKLADLLNISPGWLVFGENRPIDDNHILIYKDVFKKLITKVVDKKYPAKTLGHIIYELAHRMSELDMHKSDQEKAIDICLKYYEKYE